MLLRIQFHGQIDGVRDMFFHILPDHIFPHIRKSDIQMRFINHMYFFYILIIHIPSYLTQAAMIFTGCVLSVPAGTTR